ncbi:hypothetical protein PQ786_04185 [Alcaligenes faecalis]
MKVKLRISCWHLVGFIIPGLWQYLIYELSGLSLRKPVKNAFTWMCASDFGPENDTLFELLLR